MTLPIPSVALEDCGIVFGKRGAGKSNSLMVLLEHELDAGHRSVMIDPKGDRWGIRLNPDKSPSRFNIPILGGEHGDRPVTADMGELLGRIVAENDVSMLIDLSKLSIGDKQRFMMGFAPTLLERNRAALTLFVEEVHQFANIDLKYQPTMLVHHMSNFGTLGRTHGIVLWCASQRPAQVNATLRSQNDTVVGHKVVSELDRAAYKGWFEGAGGGFAKRIAEEVGSLDKGESFVWVSETGFTERVQWPRASTYDSGRTPKHGERIDAVTLPKLSGDALAGLLEGAATKDADARLSDFDTVDLIDELERRDPEWLKSHDEFRAAIADRNEWMAKAEDFDARINAAIRALGVRPIDEIANDLEDKRWASGLQRARIPAQGGGGPTGDQGQTEGAAVVATPTPRVTAPAPAARTATGKSAGGNAPAGGALPPRHIRLLGAVAWTERFLRKASAPRNIVAWMADTSPNSSGFEKDLGAMRTAGLLEYPSPGFVALTDAGRARAPEQTAPADRATLWQEIARKLPPRQVRLIDALIAAAMALTRADLATRVETSSQSSGFEKDLGRLRTLGLIEYPTSGVVALGDLLR